MNPTALLISTLVLCSGNGSPGAQGIPDPSTVRTCSIFTNPWILAGSYDPNDDPGKGITADPHGCDPHDENHGCMPADKALPSDHMQNHYYGKKNARGCDGPDPLPP